MSCTNFVYAASSFLDTGHEKCYERDYLEWLYINEGILLQHIPDGNHTECSNVFQRAIIQHATIYSRQQSHWMLQHAPHSNHTECFNVFHAAVIQNATTYSRQQSYRMLQHTLDNNHTEWYNIFQKAIVQNATTYSRLIIQNATTYSRQQSYRHIECYNIFQTAIMQNATSYSRQHATGHTVREKDIPQQLMYKHSGRPFEHVTWDLPVFIDEIFFW